MNTLQQACARSRAPRFVLTAFLSAVCVGSPALASEEGARFRDFFGVAQGGFNQEPLLWGKAVSANRYGYLWGREEEVQGSPDPSYIQGLINDRLLPGNALDVMTVPMLGYNTDWSWDASDRTYYDTPDGLENSPTYGHAETRFRMKPLGGNQFEQTTHTWNSWFNTWVPDTQRIVEGDRLFALRADYVDEWVDFVTRTTTTLQQHDVEYFQIWNEAYPTSGFWEGGLDDYMQRVHLPAAQAIHSLGGKVVYGGWADGGGVAYGNVIDHYIDTLDAWDAWDSIDVLDVHYSTLNGVQKLYDAAVARGHGDLGIWKTEYGWTSDTRKIGNTYPRFLRWALQHGGKENPDKYKLFWFANWSPDDPNAYGYQRALFAGDELSNHGISLQTLSELLDGEGLDVRDDVNNSYGWTANFDEKGDSVEAFELVNRTVIAIHTDNDSGSIALSIPGYGDLSLEELIIQRVDPSGFETDLSNNASIQGDNLVLSVDFANHVLSPVHTWSGGSLDTFYVLIETLVPGIPGDLYGDGFVGIEDLNLVLAYWNQTNPLDHRADATGDGFVGIDDLNLVLSNWNAGTPPGDSANIPEPASAWALALGLGLGTRLSRQRDVPA